MKVEWKSYYATDTILSVTRYFAHLYMRNEKTQKKSQYLLKKILDSEIHGQNILHFIFKTQAKGVLFQV